MTTVRKRWGFTALALAALGVAMLPAAALGAPPPDTPPPAPPEKPIDGGPVVVRSEKNDVSPPLKSIPPVPVPAGAHAPALGRPQVVAPAPGPLAPAGGNDPVLQTAPATAAMPATSVNFDGIGNSSGVYPPDPNGDVGPNHYVQIVNLSFAVYNKAGALLLGPLATNTLWSGFGGLCETTNSGDPIVLYDGMADRWMISQFAFSSTSGPFYQCFAISQTGDPTGSYYRYAFFWSSQKMNDYPKFGIWPDGYYGHYNQFCNNATNWCGSGVVVYDRERMRQGLPATAIAFDLAVTNPSDSSMLPSHLNGPPPPSGTPNYYVDYTSNTALRIFEFHADWGAPLNSTFGSGASHAPNATVTVAAFDNDLCSFGLCVPQPGTTQKLDTLSDRLMYRLQYRNFGSYASLVVNQTVDTNGADHAGIRWWELRRTGSTWNLQQEGTYSPDTDHRWMGSIAMDKDGDIALGYSISSSATSPGIRYAGRLAGDPAGQLSQGETTLIAGSGSQTGTLGRWGDYTSMSVDPSDGCTFWYTDEYYATTSSTGWKTRIGAFKFPSCTAVSNPSPTVSTLSPPSATAGDAPLTLTVNGTNFVYNSIVRLNGSDRATTYVSGTQLTASITAADLASAGTPSATVFNPTPGGGTSSGATFTINAFVSNPAPTITKITPSAAVAGAAAFDLIVDGTNFVAASTVRWNGALRTTTVISSTRLSAQISASDVAVAGSASVAVNNPSPGGGTSSSLAFGISVSNDNVANATLLATSSISLIQSTTGFTTEGTDPNMTTGCGSNSRKQQSASAWFQLAPSTSGTLSLDTQGSSYDTVLAVLTGSPGSFTVIACNDDVGGGLLWSTLPSVALSGGTTYYVEVTSYGTGAGGTLFLNGSYSGSLANPVPATTSLNPGSIAAGSPGLVLTVNGTNFVGGSVVRWNGSDRATAFVSSSQLAASIPATDIAAAGTSTVTVFNPAPGGGTSGGQAFTINLQAKVVFTQQPSGGTAGVAFATQPWVAVQDINGNTVTTDNSTQVTLLLKGPGTTGLSCTGGLTKTVASGVAQFTGCNVTVVNNGYSLHAVTNTGLTPADSNTFDVTPAPNKLGFTQQPSNGVTGVVLATQPQVAVQDGSGNTITTDNATQVTITSSGGSLACTATTVTVSAGIASFANCAVTGTGTFTLHATSSPALVPADSTPFTITGAATRVVFTQQPASGITSTAFALQPVVAIQDASGATVVSDNTSTVTLSVFSGPGALACTANPKAVVNGVATFSGCSVNAAGTYVIRASSGALTTADTSSFVVTGPATKLAFSQQPNGGTTNKTFGLQPTVVVQDASNNTVVSDSATVITLSISSGPGGASLTCNSVSVTVVNGVAAFGGCEADTPGAYVLHAASSPVYTAADTGSFTITGPAAQLVFTAQPAGAINGVAFPVQPVVAVKDAFGTTVASDSTTTVTLSRALGTGTLTCSSGLVLTVTSGVAAFTGCSLDATGNHALQAVASPVLTTATTATFAVTGPADHLLFTQQPSGGFAGVAFPTQPIVAVQDATGATVAADSTTQVTIALTGPGATLACTNPGNLTMTVTNGLATFAGCNVNTPNSGYGLHATSSPVYTAADSATFTVTGPAAKLAFVQQPPSAGTGFQFTVAVAIQDSAGHTTFADNTTVVALTLNGGGSLTCSTTLSVAVVSGIATFQECAVDTAGSHTLHAASGALAPADSSAFNALSTAGVHWYFAEGFTGLGWNTTVHLLNTSASTTANVQVNYLLDSGSPVLRSVTVPPLRDVVLDASNLAQGPGSNVAFGLLIVSDIPIVAEEQMYAGASGDFAHGTTGSQALSSSWYFAEGFTQFGWQTFVLVANPGSVAANVTITYQVQGGSAATNTVSVGAGKRWTFLGHVDVPNQAFSVSISSSQPIVSEMAMYDPNRTIAHRTVGVTQAASEWYLGEGFTGFGWETFISVGNPGSVDATVTAVYGIDGGSPVTKQIIVPAHSRGTFIARDAASGPGADVAFGVHVTSTQPVVVQEVLIDPAAGASRANSTMASASLNAKWSFSGGSSQTGVVSFYTVSNPGGTAVTVTATYYFDDGTAPVSQVLNIPANSRGTFATAGGTPAVPSGHRVGVIIVSSGGSVVAQEAVYDETNVRAYSAGGAPGP